MKLTEFTPIHPVRIPGDSTLHSHVSVAKHPVALETAQLGVEVRKGSVVVLVPWSNVVQAVPVAETAPAVAKAK